MILIDAESCSQPQIPSPFPLLHSPPPIPHLNPNKKIPLLATSSQSPFKKIKVTI